MTEIFLLKPIEIEIIKELFETYASSIKLTFGIISSGYAWNEVNTTNRAKAKKKRGNRNELFSRKMNK